jgi:hypothetical protein
LWHERIDPGIQLLDYGQIAILSVVVNDRTLAGSTFIHAQYAPMQKKRFRQVHELTKLHPIHADLNQNRQDKLARNCIAGL